MGENRGVVGVELGAGRIVIVAMAGPESATFSTGNAFHEEVTSRVFSTALRYLPTVLYCLVGYIHSSHIRWIVNGGHLRVRLDVLSERSKLHALLKVV